MLRVQQLTLFFVGTAAPLMSMHMSGCFLDRGINCIGVNSEVKKECQGIKLDDSRDAGGQGGMEEGGGSSGNGGAPALCGNNQLDDSEECDDGNDGSADGCSSKCMVEDCYTCTSTPSTCTLKIGMACDETTYCDSKGQCVEQCFDTVKDSDEAGIDCGGSTCKSCPGKSCIKMDDCATGFCADGVCCDVACDGKCSSCSLPGNRGICSDVPAGEDDSNSIEPCNGPGNTCGIEASCVDKKENGQGCSKDDECASGACPPGSPRVCKQATGTPCDNGEVCASNNCIDNLCAP